MNFINCALNVQDKGEFYLKKIQWGLRFIIGNILMCYAMLMVVGSNKNIIAFGQLFGRWCCLSISNNMVFWYRVINSHFTILTWMAAICVNLWVSLKMLSNFY